jgi:hypothetical protein
MCPRRNKSDNSKRPERETRQQEKKSREKKAHGKKDDDEREFRNYLQKYNLQLRNIIGDGNCLFRSCKLKIRLFSINFILFHDSCRSVGW